MSSVDAAVAWRAMVTAASEPYQRAGKFAWHFARGKLGRDPVFRGMLERGDLAARAHVVDIGCGQGLIASLLWACQQQQAARRITEKLKKNQAAHQVAIGARDEAATQAR